MVINMLKSINPNALLFILGFLGIISMVPLIPELLALQSEPLTISVEMLQVISVIQSSVLLLFMVWLGAVFSKKVGLASPVAFALSNSKGVYKALKPQLIPAFIGGVIGGIILSIISGYLPTEFLSVAGAFVPPWYTKVLYGGITEELLVRWGLMSFIVWGLYRLTQTSGSVIKSHNYILAIIVSALIFGMGHLPIVFALASDITFYLVTYIVMANAAFGFIAGYLYWKYGLECAIGAHMMTHMTLIIGASFF